MGQTQGGFSRIAIDGDKYCFARFEDHTVWTLADASEDNICGKLDVNKEDVLSGIITPRIHFLIQPTPEEIDALLPLIGTSENVDTFSPIEDFSSIDIDAVLDRVVSVDLYEEGVVDKLFIRGQKGNKPMTWELQVIFKAVTIDVGGSFTPTAVSGTTTPYWLHHGTLLTLASTATPFQSFVFAVDNHLNAQHNNSQYPQSILPAKRTFHLGVDLPWTAATAPRITAFTGETDGTPPADEPSTTGYSGSLVFSRGIYQFGMNFHNLKAEAKMPDVLGKEETRLKMFYQAFGTGSTPPVTFTSVISA